MICEGYVKATVYFSSTLCLYFKHMKLLASVLLQRPTCLLAACLSPTPCLSLFPWLAPPHHNFLQLLSVSTVAWIKFPLSYFHSTLLSPGVPH